MPELERVVVVNRRNQPVELHLGTDVLVLEPLQRVEVELEGAPAQLARLRSRGFIDVNVAKPPAKPATKKKPAPKRRKQPDGGA